MSDEKTSPSTELVTFIAKKPKGRPKGRKTSTNALLKQAQDQIRELYGDGPQFKNWDPVVWLMVTAANPGVDWDLRIAAAGKAAPYIHAPVKAVEKPTDNTPKHVDTEALMQRVAKDLLIENKVPIDELILGGERDRATDDVEYGDEDETEPDELEADTPETAESEADIASQ